MQHVPQVARTDVERIIARDFGADAVSHISSLLEVYGTATYHREVDRVHLDILKLANGNVEELKNEVESACCDYRDTMLAAEYPNYAKKMFQIQKLSAEEREQLCDADRRQYELWLNGPSPDDESVG